MATQASWPNTTLQSYSNHPKTRSYWYKIYCPETRWSCSQSQIDAEVGALSKSRVVGKWRACTSLPGCFRLAGKLWQFIPTLLLSLANGKTVSRCETILQPGYNCTVRVVKSRAKKRRRSKKPRTPTQNHVVYSCQFCMYRNLKRGTPKGHVRELHPAKARPISQKKSKKIVCHISGNLEIETACGDEGSKTSLPGFSASEAVLQTSSIPEIETAHRDENSKISVPGFPVSEAVPSDNKLSTPVTKPSLELLSESRWRKRNRSLVKKSAEPEGGPASAEASVSTSKKRRKSWTTLKEIAERSESGTCTSISDLKIPFLI